MGFIDHILKRDDSVEHHTQTVREILHALGLDPDEHHIEESNGTAWVIKRGSVLIYIHLFSHETKGYLKVMAPIVILPEQQREKLFERLLVANMNMINCALGLKENTVCVFSERSLDYLDKEEADEIIKRVAFYADELDNKLVEEFGGRLFSAKRDA
jgi:hypothetical protein